MSFVPAGEIIGQAHRVRTIELRDSPQLPDGEYAFIDSYCTDPTCDCRKTMIQVMHDGDHVSTINYGWESPEFYRQWVGGDPDESMYRMCGATIDFTSPNKVSPEGMLALFHALLNEKWLAMIKKNYKVVKKQLADTEATGPTVSG